MTTEPIVLLSLSTIIALQAWILLSIVDLKTRLARVEQALGL